ncbi:LmeA family phospholipid-binding protein [Rhodococcus sp. DSM 6344]|nr:LmeA family phospholipid-binding protein [Rhodococcus erythropolis]
MRKLIIGIVFLLGLGLVADFGAAAYAEYRVSRELRTGASLESDPEVTFNGFPFLTQALGGKYKDVYVRATGVESDVVGEVTVEADLRGVTVPFSDIVNGNVTQLPVDKLDGRMGINATDLGKLLNIPDLQVSSPPANKSDGTGGSGGTGASTAGAVVLTGTVAVGPVETAVSVQANLVLEGGQVKIVASNLYFGPEGKADFSIPAALEPVVLGLFSYTIDPQALPYGIQPSLVYAEGGRIVIEGSAENTTIDLAELQNR